MLESISSTYRELTFGNWAWILSAIVTILEMRLRPLFPRSNNSENYIQTLDRKILLHPNQIQSKCET
jgi:hypothetical protein